MGLKKRFAPPPSSTPGNSPSPGAALRERYLNSGTLGMTPEEIHALDVELASREEPTEVYIAKEGASIRASIAANVEIQGGRIYAPKARIDAAKTLLALNGIEIEPRPDPLEAIATLFAIVRGEVPLPRRTLDVTPADAFPSPALPQGLSEHDDTPPLYPSGPTP